MNSHSWNIGNCVHFCLSLDVTLWCPQFFCNFYCDFCDEVTCHLRHCRMYLDVWWAKRRESPFKFPASEHQHLNMQGRRGIILFDWEFIDRWHEGQSIKTRLWCSKFKAMTHDFCHVSSNWAILKITLCHHNKNIYFFYVYIFWIYFSSYKEHLLYWQSMAWWFFHCEYPRWIKTSVYFCPSPTC